MITLLYKEIARLGSRTGVLIFSTAPAMTAVLAYALLKESLGCQAVAGIAVTLGGICWVISEHSPGPGIQSKISLAGVGLVFGAALCQAGGMILMKQGLASQIHSLYATLIRMIGATLFRAMETIKSTMQLVFLPGFRVAPMGTYFNMLPLARLETRQKFDALLVDF